MGSPPDSLKHYLKKIEQQILAGNATEHTHRPALKAFVEALEHDLTATNEPKHVECGAPDFVVTRPPGPMIIGYIETKDIGKSLDDEERSEQLQRYRRSLGNLILTDYLGFRWYVDGELRESARLARAGKCGRLVRDKNGEKLVVDLLHDFLSHAPEPISSPRELAQRMARLAQIIREIILEVFDKDKASGLLRDLRKAFAEALIPDLDLPPKTGEFADMYAQTIAYGLFAARCNHHRPDLFRRLGAAAEIPKTNPFLRRLFETITGTDLNDEPYAGFVDDLVQLLDKADMEAILRHFGKRARREDPVLHFYETFLATYDPKMREMRGVYYTPEPVVSYIVRSVDHLLRARFGLVDGLADTAAVEYEREEDGNKPSKVKAKAPKVLILDPACGTGTFLYAVIDLIREQFRTRNDAGMWSGYVRRHLLPRIFGFELLMAPYAVAHFKLGMQLAGQDMSEAQRELWEYDFEGDERLGIYLTNTLEEAELHVQTMVGPLRVIIEEANAAVNVKRDLPIMVILGNPPYSGHSANLSEKIQFIPSGEKYYIKGNRLILGTAGKKGAKIIRKTFIGKLIQDYYYVDGKKLEERNPKWLQDDYVKFIRWAQWRIDRTGAGILAFISNHSYLDNPTFRGMRQSLMKSFNQIYILDLHGNVRKKERSPDGSKDENVFDIQQGVAIGIFVKNPGKTESTNIYHAELWGLRKYKEERLSEEDVKTTRWTKLSPQSPFYLFRPQEINLLNEYNQYWKIVDIMQCHGVGMTTARDHIVIDFDADKIIDRARIFRDSPLSDHEVCQQLGIPLKKGWNINNARKMIRQVKDLSAQLKPVLYRPFDVRLIFYHDSLIWRTVRQVMQHMLKENVSLLTCRQQSTTGFQHVHCASLINDNCIVSNKTKERGYAFPLYLYPDPSKRHGQIERWPPGKDGRRPNLNSELVAELERRLGLIFVPDGRGDFDKTFSPEDVFHYIYAILHSPTYRERYSEFLKIDFPRVPLTSDKDLFRKLCALGCELVALHLMESPTLSKFFTRYPIPGDNLVEKGHPKYLASGEPEPGTGRPLEKGRVYINRAQYFDGVPEEAWEFQIGGYQVCQKWLKDRQGRKLSYDDLTHYQKIMVAIKETMRLMEKIVEAIPGWPIL